MGETAPGFLGNVLRRYFGAEFVPCPPMQRDDVEKLLADDSQRRIEIAEHSALEWGRSEVDGDVEIVSERLMITPRGLVYAACLRTSSSSRRRPEIARTSLYYVATPREHFDPMVDQVRTTPLLLDSTAAVDCTYQRELLFPWPLDTRLRRLLDSHEVFVRG